MELPKYFTLNEAKKLLPDLKPRIYKLMKLNKTLSLIQSVDIDSDDPILDIDLAVMDLNKNYFKKMYLFYKELSEVTKLGAVVKDIDEGLVDFYSKYQGREILLCWKLGEKNIDHWHELNTGFNNRKHIKLLKKQN
ncbi:DUF2203 domain-containing protein [Candidatus Woesearchaeota archaeon]|nr:DUF2203 domain-containing protein [Candidatus Woesearchaeota archaeon]